MTLQNRTINQHYVSQVEQRLNASNASASTQNQKIYSFDVLQHGTSEERYLGPAISRPISRNLALGDVFSFDVAPGSDLRQNFESLFSRYERLLLTHTRSLLEKVEAGSSDIQEEIVGLFSAKLLNFMRNPYSVPKVLNTFKGIVDHRPTNANQAQLFDIVLAGRKPHQKALCKFLGLSDDQYRLWLATLFMMLAELGVNGASLFDDLVQQMFTSQEHVVGVMVCRYTEHKCLLSDRSFSTNTQSPHTDGFDFNLRHDSFIRYIFTSRANLLPTGAPLQLRKMLETMPLDIHFTHLVDDLKLLRSFNMNVIHQSFRQVFCASPDGILY